MSDGEPDFPGDVLARLGEVLGRHGIHDFALTGGVAVGVWSAPRQTRDLDVCASVPPTAVNALLARFDGVRAGTGEVPRVLQDAADVRAVVKARAASLDHAYLRRWLPAGQADLIEQVAKMTDDELVRRLSALG